MRQVKQVIMSLLIILVIFTYPLSYYNSQEVVTIEVLDKERIGLDNGKYKFLVYSTGEVFENTDTFLFLKYRSSDLQRDLTTGETFDVKVAGWRVPFLSWHRNIIKIEK